MIRAAIYVRVSTTRQADNDLSIPDQIAQCKAYCERKGWDVAEVFCEPGASAMDDDRPFFQEMIYKAKGPDRPFTFVVVHSLSRFSRDAMHSELYVRQLAKVGVQLVSITQDVGNDASGEFIRKVLNVFDEHSSRENAKHVHRAMCENTRQGFWNGSAPPYGYKIEIAERRGNKDKKVLVLHEDESRIVIQMFEMTGGSAGRSLGVKAIATFLNERGFRRRGRLFSTGGIYDILTSSTYYGQHYFNKTDSRQRIVRPPSQWIGLKVPALISEETFNIVQGMLHARNPKLIAPRVVNGPTFLAGLARCGYCQAAMIQNTGKGGLYRYYCCSRKLKQGPLACRGMRMPMDKLDTLVVSEVTRRVLQPQRLEDLLKAYVETATSREDQNKERLGKLRHSRKDAETGLTRLLELVEKGVMDAQDASLRERLIGLKVRRDELAKDITELSKRMGSAEPALTQEKIAKAGALLADRLYSGPIEMRQAYARLILNEVQVTEDEIRISGSKSVLAKTASDDAINASPGVLSFVREWRAQKDSNL